MRRKSMSIVLSHAQLISSAERYKARTPTRRAGLKQLTEKGLSAVETPERLHVREALMERAGLGEDIAQMGLERVIGLDDLLPLRYLEIGLLRARSVCRIEIHNRDGGFEGYGTGFLVSPDLLMTNNHVLATAAAARRSLAEFNYEDDANLTPKPAKLFKMDPERLFFTDEQLDMTLVALLSQATDGSPLADFGHLTLIAESGKATLGESVSVIQHPRGHKKQIAVRANRIVDVFDDYVHYETDTMPGSSGSPVFNDQWELVALHHSGVPRRNAAGRVLAVNGRIWKEEMGEDRIDWVANEGIRVSSIVRRVQERPDWTPAQQTLLDQMVRHL
jgi:V8-like Glu-specific endopeptidase